MKLPFLLILGILLWSCSADDPGPDVKDDEWVDPLDGIPDKGPIRFDNPEVGQRSQYVYFEASKNLASGQVTFAYKPDTLVLAITGKESDKFVVREFMSKGSENLAFNEVIIRHLAVDSDSAYLSKPSGAFSGSLVFAGDNLSIPLQPVTDPATLNSDCLPLFGYAVTEWMQYTTDYEQFGQTFNHLNDYFDYTDMTFDGIGLMYAYGPSYGFVRWTWVSPWEQDIAEGFDLLPHKH